MNTQLYMRSEQTIIWLLRLVIVGGILMAFLQFFANRSLWLDEAMLALNIVDNDWVELLRPLKYDQVAPIGFLFIEKLIIELAGSHRPSTNDLLLRIIPLLSYLLCIPLLIKLGERLTQSSLIANLSAAMFAVNPSVMYYSSEVKQYASDCLFTLMILYAYVLYHNEGSRFFMFYAAIGAISIWFSNVAVIALFICGILMLANSIKRKTIGPTGYVIGAWLLSFGCYYAFFIHEHPTKDFMVKYWQSSFLPLSLGNSEMLIFLKKEVFSKLIYRMGYEDVWPFIAIFVVIGAIRVFRKNQAWKMFLLAGPTLVHLMLSGLHLYPFSDRLILYQLPLLTLLGSYLLINGAEFKQLYVKTVLSLIFLWPVINLGLLSLDKFPSERSNMKQIMALLDEEISETERVKVYGGFDKTIIYYQQYFDNLEYLDFQFIKDGHENLKELAIEESQYTNRRWLLFKDMDMIELEPDDWDVEAFISYLESEGFKLDRSVEFQNESLYLIYKPNQ